MPSRCYRQNGVSCCRVLTVHGRQRAHLLVMALIPSLLRDESGSISSRVTIVRSVKLLTPEMDDVRKPLKKDAFDLLVQLCNPLVEVRVAFQVQPIDLIHIVR